MLKAHLWSGPMLCGLAGPLKTLHKEARSVINLSQASFKALREPASIQKGRAQSLQGERPHGYTEMGLAW